jgi:hypothetical protein
MVMVTTIKTAIAVPEELLADVDPAEARAVLDEAGTPWTNERW